MAASEVSGLASSSESAAASADLFNPCWLLRDVLLVIVLVRRLWARSDALTRPRVRLMLDSTGVPILVAGVVHAVVPSADRIPDEPHESLGDTSFFEGMTTFTAIVAPLWVAGVFEAS